MKKWAKKENLTGKERWEKEEKERKLTVWERKRERERRERERIVFKKEKWESGFDSKVVEIIKKEYKMII